MLGIGGTVGVFVAMLAVALGFRVTLVSPGSTDNALIRRAGSTSEMDGAISLDQVRVTEDARGVARKNGRPLISPEVVVIAAFPLKSTGVDANVQVRSVLEDALKVRNNIRIKEGRFLEPGLTELVVGKNAVGSYSGLDLGKTVLFGGGTWKVTGVSDVAVPLIPKCGATRRCSTKSTSAP